MSRPLGAFKVTLVPIDELIPHERNPQLGDVGAVATAIATDGWHLACLAQAPAKGRDQPRLIAGHTRWRALAALQRDGWDNPMTDEHVTYEELATRVPLPPAGFIPVQIQEMDDVRALRKLIADNRASALATVDEREIIGILEEFAADDALLGSLFDGDDLDALIADLNRVEPPDEPDDPGAKVARPVQCPNCGTEFVPERVPA